MPAINAGGICETTPAPTQGPWLSPDPAGLAAADPANPQTWNRYAYVANQPLRATDPLGLGTNVFTGCTSGMTGPYSGWVNCTDPGSVYLDNPGANGAGDFLCGSGEPWQQLDPSCREYGTPARGGTGDGGSERGGAGARTGKIASTWNVSSDLKCAASHADDWSLAGLLGHIPGLGGGIGGFVTHAFAGNTFSAVTDIFFSFAHGQAGGHSVLYQAGLAETAGPTQGLGPALEAAGADIADSPFGTGPVDAVVGALFGEYATGIGEIKLALDGVAFLGAGAACIAGWAR